MLGLLMLGAVTWRWKDVVRSFMGRVEKYQSQHFLSFDDAGTTVSKIM